jgi:hypothetical protein
MAGPRTGSGAAAFGIGALIGMALRTWFDAHVTELYGREEGTFPREELSPEDVSTLRALGYLD